MIGDYARLSEVTNESYGLSGLGEKTLELGGLSHRFTVGGNFATGTTSQYSSGVDSCNVAPSYSCNFLHTNQADMPDVDSTQFGIFLDDEIAFSDSGFSLTPGLRFDWYDHSPKETAAYQVNPNYNGLLKPVRVTASFLRSCLENMRSRRSLMFLPNGLWRSVGRQRLNSTSTTARPARICVSAMRR